MFHEELLSYRKKLATEMTIEGRILTPLDWIEQDIIDKISELDCEYSRKYFEEGLEILANLHEKVLSGKHHSQIRNVLVVQLLMLRRAMVLDQKLLASENIDRVLKQVWKSYGELRAEKRMRLDILKEIKLGCFNSIKGHEEKSLKQFFLTLGYIFTQEFDGAVDKVTENVLEALLVVMSFAFLDSEFYITSKSFEIVKDAIFKIFDVKKLVKSFEIMTKHYDPSLTLRYHNWFKNIIMARSKLPKVEKKREGFRGFDLVYDHPSEFIQRSYLIGIGECARFMIRKLKDEAKIKGGKRKSKPN